MTRYAFHSNIRVNWVTHDSGIFFDDEKAIEEIRLVPNEESMSLKSIKKSHTYKLEPTSVDNIRYDYGMLDIPSHVINISRMIAREDKKNFALDQSLQSYFNAISGIDTGDVSSKGKPLTTVMTTNEINEKQKIGELKTIQINRHLNDGYTKVYLFPEIRASYNFSGDVIEYDAFIGVDYTGDNTEDEFETKVESRKYRVTLRPNSWPISFDFRKNTLDFTKDEGDVDISFYRSEFDKFYSMEEILLPKITCRRNQTFNISFNGFIPNKIDIIAIAKRINGIGGTANFGKIVDPYLDLIGKFESKHFRKNMTSTMKMFVNVTKGYPIGENYPSVDSLIKEHLEYNEKLLEELKKETFRKGSKQVLQKSLIDNIYNLKMALKDGTFTKLYDEYNKEDEKSDSLIFNGSCEPLFGV